jgi:hypothetical protein
MSKSPVPHGSRAIGARSRQGLPARLAAVVALLGIVVGFAGCIVVPVHRARPVVVAPAHVRPAPVIIVR